jgi:predicted DNA-binding transcriptional regulator AlpA
MPTKRPGAAQQVDPADRELELVGIRDVMRITARSRSAIYADPTFPQPISLGQPDRAVRCSRWLKHEVMEWLHERIAMRDAEDGWRRARLQERQERRQDPKRCPVMASAK